MRFSKLIILIIGCSLMFSTGAFAIDGTQKNYEKVSKKDNKRIRAERKQAKAPVKKVKKEPKKKEEMPFK